MEIMCSTNVGMTIRAVLWKCRSTAFLNFKISYRAKKQIAREVFLRYNNFADAECKTAEQSCRHFVAYYTKPWLKK